MVESGETRRMISDDLSPVSRRFGIESIRHHADSRRDYPTLLGHRPRGPAVPIREPDLAPPGLFASAKT
jgi:hypothetical protein